MTTAIHDEARATARPGLASSLGFLLLNFPAGLFGFIFLVVLASVGMSTAIIWIGVPIAGLAILAARGGARVERARIYAMLDTYIPVPYRALPEKGQRARWRVRLRDRATWRDMAYCLLLFPLGVFEFAVMVTFWATSLAFAGLPIYFRFLPEGAYYFPSYNLRWITVDSTVSALPWAALGVLFIAVSVATTKALANGHVKFARALLGPTREAEVREDPFVPATPTPVAG